jgi:SAM-dependent methyltransferase
VPPTAFDPEDDDAVSALDELPLWAAPFGLRLLDVVELRPGLAALDVGFGTGFPLLELAMRLGPSSSVHGLDPWPAAHRRTRSKLTELGLRNVTLHEGVAEQMPFEDSRFDCVVSNNGYNNVADRDRAFCETARVCRPGAQLVFTMNLDGSFRELHDVLRDVLRAEELGASLAALDALIAGRRPPLEEVLGSVAAAGFGVEQVAQEAFAFRFADAAALAGHAFFRRFQLPPLHEIVPAGRREAVFAEVQRRLDAEVQRASELRLSVPFVTVSARREIDHNARNEQPGRRPRP